MSGAPPDADGLPGLLEWAATDGPQRARTLAARIESCVVELTVLRGRWHRAESARRQVREAELKLAEARRRLREATAPQADDTAPAAPAAAEVRAWAREHGYAVGPGPLPGFVLDAYRDAQRH